MTPPPPEGQARTVIVGAGLVGTLFALYLARRGTAVTMYESRPDLRRVDIDAGRSINLALATRGIVPLIDIGLIDRLDDITVPMRGRMVHALGDPTPDLLPYGTRAHEVIHSVSRTDLNGVLLDAAEATGLVTVEFNARLESVDFDASLLRFRGGRTEPFDVVYGADGAGSRVRASMIDHGACEASTDWLDHSYKELTLPAGPDGAHQIDPHALHIWPRGEFMLIGLANPGGDFTLTLFAPTTTFADLDAGGDVDGFFAEQFADVAALAPDLATEYAEHPIGKLGTLWADGWHLDGRAVLLGDAAHAIVPFHGQGMNAGMESARILSRHLDGHPGDRGAAFAAFEAERKPDADAIAVMALENYTEMREGVVDPDYLAKRTLALELEQRHPRHLSPRYNMVMFSTMPYTEARGRADRQAEIIAAAVADPSLDVDAMVTELPPLPDNDPLNDPDALSV